jgi:hypothetical protein
MWQEAVEAMRRYDDPVEVRRGWVPDVGTEGPDQFLWRGRLWKVRAVVAHWVASGPGRSSTPTDEGASSAGELRIERELWRVEAGRGMPGPRAVTDGNGVFDLSFDGTNGRWRLVGCSD